MKVFRMVLNYSPVLIATTITTGGSAVPENYAVVLCSPPSSTLFPIQAKVATR
ncbi:MAG TPA: hypothetical protein P5317_10755 [Myxococcota bacterium]|nr:hypothetical protein [Myxococcota bacterium]HRR74839.1 hypothetical protein [Myxococcota bacterium]HRV18473.1 hypothetical protein [Myxococcota bacterium]